MEKGRGPGRPPPEGETEGKGRLRTVERRCRVRTCPLKLVGSPTPQYPPISGFLVIE